MDAATRKKAFVKRERAKTAGELDEVLRLLRDIHAKLGCAKRLPAAKKAKLPLVDVTMHSKTGNWMAKKAKPAK